MLTENFFYNRVSSWIRSYRNPEALEWLRGFVDNSAEPTNVKEQLYKEINYKEERLRKQPVFIEVEGISYMKDEIEDKPKVYATRFGAVCKLAELTLKGYDVELEELSAKEYRIKLVQAQ